MSYHHPDCFLAHFGVMENGDPMGDCSGRLIKAHLIPQQLLKREGALWAIMEPETWVWACGGPMGNSGHHGLFDGSRTLRLPPWSIPAETIDFVRDLGLLWWLNREYGGNWE